MGERRQSEGWREDCGCGGGGEEGALVGEDETET